ncbi:uncharacterized protein LOC141914620 [Tubulanus polymorphus]|uniref:uncharacterized protein LOC141914620 n=1 Tax=Tubulanus polymorphus TaxID=672921 RepID=UPI003DA60CE0
MHEFITSHIGAIIGYILVILIPGIHIGSILYFWTPYKRDLVDTLTCRCPCFDTIFKGSYENFPSKYKHIYFNATWNTWKIWSITFLAGVVLYEAVKRLIHLFTTRRLRWQFLMLFIVAFYSHYFSWWVYFNYLNDDFYKQWFHQLFFTVSEFVSSFIVFQLCDCNIEITWYKLLIIITISLTHIVISCVDQFIQHIFYSKGWRHQIIRDLGLMIPDLLHLFIPLFHVLKCLNQSGIKRRQLIKDLITALIFIVVIVPLISFL